MIMKTLKRKRAYILNAFIALIFIIGSLSCEKRQTENQKLDDITPKIEEVINKAVELELFSGCVLVAQEGEVIFSGAYGEANKDFHIKNTLDTKFNIASGTKPFTSTSIMLLVQKGLISINDPVTKYY